MSYNRNKRPVTDIVAVNNLLSNDLSSYATQNWVQNQNYLTSLPWSADFLALNDRYTPRSHTGLGELSQLSDLHSLHLRHSELGTKSELPHHSIVYRQFHYAHRQHAPRSYTGMGERSKLSPNSTG
jgi:hypothetical protein